MSRSILGNPLSARHAHFATNCSHPHEICAVSRRLQVWNTEHHAGGFARGLIELRKAGWATHVLFMDDDITLEPEAIVRTMSRAIEANSDPVAAALALVATYRAE